MKSYLAYFVLFLISISNIQFLNSTSTRNKFKSNYRGKFLMKNSSHSHSHSHKEIPNLNNEEDSSNKQLDINLDDNEGNTPLWSGWVKYYHSAQSSQFQEPGDFFVNREFFNQKVLNQDLLKRGRLPGDPNTLMYTGAYLNVPSQFHFYAFVNNHFLEINSSRKDTISGRVESLNLDTVDPLSLDTDTTGVKQIGKFREGHCLDLTTHKLHTFTNKFVPTYMDYKNSSQEHWIICFEFQDALKSFNSVLSAVLNSKEKTRDRPKELEGKKEAQQEETSSIERYKGPDADPNLDGYLIKINDWTQCTLKCGGGWSFQQWKCVPPKVGGKPCHGELIRKRKCNENPCPQIAISSGSANNSAEANIKKETVVQDPIIKSDYVSSRPQQNIDCLIREEDVLHVYNDKDTGKVAIPKRLVLTKNTLTLFTSVETNKTVFSFDITKLKMVPNKNEACCFYVRSETKSFNICGMSKCSNFISSWIYSLDLFKSKCYPGIPKAEEFPDKAHPIKLKNDSNDFSAAMEMDDETAKAKSDILLEKLEQKTKKSNLNKTSETEKQYLKAINREIDVEDLLRKEELQKAQERIKEKLAEMKKEEERQRKLEEAFNKQSENEASKKEIQEDLDLKNIKKQAEKEILERRNQLKKKLEVIRKNTERRTKIIQNKINIIRNKMNSNIINATKSGDSEKCKSTFKNQPLMNKYCDEHVNEDYNKNLECKIEENFCFACCDSEFGSANTKSKDQCYKLCLGEEAFRGEWLSTESSK